MDGEISPSELERLLEADESPVIVDIRSPHDFRREHIPGSRNVPFQSLSEEIEQFRNEDHVITVCPHGKASVQAANLITSFEGFNGRVESLESGIAGWDGSTESDGGTHKGESDSTEAPF